MALGNHIEIKNQLQLDEFIKNLKAEFAKEKRLEVEVKSRGYRTLTQNKALHLYCGMVADALNDAGYDVNTFFKGGYSVPFSKEIVKTELWKPIQKAMTDETSTTKVKKLEYSDIYDVLNSKLAEYGIHVPFPSRENLG